LRKTIIVFLCLLTSLSLVSFAEAASYQFVGSKDSNVYHYPTCSAAERIKPENLVTFLDAQDAVDHGSRPCQICHPPLPQATTSPTNTPSPTPQPTPSIVTPSPTPTLSTATPEPTISTPDPTATAEPTTEPSSSPSPTTSAPLQTVSPSPTPQIPEFPIELIIAAYILIAIIALIVRKGRREEQ
jgi:hypothetical protein